MRSLSLCTELLFSVPSTSKAGYWQVEMEPESIPKTAFTTSSGLYEFLRLPFGLKNSAATFQRLMELVLKDVKGKSCFVYIDDVVVYSKSEEEHLVPPKSSLPVSKPSRSHPEPPEVSTWCRSLWRFYGHVSQQKESKTDPAKVEAVG